MKRRLLIALVVLATSAVHGGTPRLPTKVTIIDVPAERRGYGTNVGDVKVSFSDGRSEVWTSTGRCMYAKVSPNGIVGWTRYTGRNAYGEPINNMLRIRFVGGRTKDFPHGPFIEEWGFTEDEAAVVIKSRGRHGPARYIKYDLRSGSVIDSVGMSKPYDRLPPWAQPYADDRPNV